MALRAMTRSCHDALIVKSRLAYRRFQGDCWDAPRLSPPVRASAGRGRDRLLHQRHQAVGRHQHVERRRGGAARRGDVLAQRRGDRAERCSSSPEPATVSRASLAASSAGRPAAAPASPALRPAGTHRPGRSPTPRSPHPSAPRRRPIRPRRWRPAAHGRACAAVAVTRALATATVMPRPIAAGVFGMARTTAACAASACSRKPSVRPAMIETTTVAGPT